MEPIAVYHLAPLAKAAWGFSQEPTLHQLLTAVADVEGQAAARAIEDAASSSQPGVHLQGAITLLRSTYEKYYVRSQNRTSSPAGWIQALLHTKRAARARFNAAVTALTIAHACRTIGDEQQVEHWRQRAREHFLDSYLELVTLQPGTLVDSAGLPGSSNSVYIGPEDEVRYEARIAALKQAFEIADRGLGERNDACP